MIVCLYEDSGYKGFAPLTHLRPVYTLRAGIQPLFKKAENVFPGAKLIFTCREQLAPLLAETYRDYPVNIIKKPEDDVLLLNGRLRDPGDLPRLVKEARISTFFRNHEEVVAVLLKKAQLKSAPHVATLADYEHVIHAEEVNLPDCLSTATLYRYCWEIVSDIDKEITADFNLLVPNLPPSRDVKVHDGVFWVEADQAYLGNNVEIKPGAVIDASGGPVYISDNCTLEPHTSIIGPVYVGPNSVVMAGKITGSSIGHTCRVGGEVEASVFQAYVNKYHAGFIGHSYVGQWVNFGAMTTNSDLKNNYSNIRVFINGKGIDAASNKIGSFIGDHTKFGIGTLLNTGINIGVGCNLFGGGLFTDKEIDDFRWGIPGKLITHSFDKVIETARIVSERRGARFSDHEVAVLRALNVKESSDKGILDLSHSANHVS